MVRLGVVVCVAAALLLSACTGDPDPSPTTTPTQPVTTPKPYVNPVREAVADLAWSPAVRYRGTVNDPLRRPVTLDLTMTTEASGLGTFKVGGQAGRILVVDGATYLRADAPFWRTFPRVLEEAGKAEKDLRARGGAAYIEDLVRETVRVMAGGITGNWTKVDPADIGLIDPKSLAPQAIAGDAGSALAGADVLKDGVPTSVGKQAATKLQAGPDLAYYTSRRAPYRLLRVEATSGAAGLRLDLTRLDTAKAQQVRDDLAYQVGGLDTALDLQIELEYIPKRRITITCTRSGGCKTVAKLTTAGKLAPLAGGTMIAVAVGPNGYLGTCLTAFGGFALGKTRQAACTVNTSALRQWYTSGSGLQSWFNTVLLPNRGLGATALADLRNRLAMPPCGDCGPLPEAEIQLADREAAEAWETWTGRPARTGGCEIYLRIPAEWAHLLGGGDPLAVANLVAMRPADHRQLVAANWSARRTLLFGREPTAREVETWALEVDRQHGQRMHVPTTNATPTCT